MGLWFVHVCLVGGQSIRASDCRRQRPFAIVTWVMFLFCVGLRPRSLLLCGVSVKGRHTSGWGKCGSPASWLVLFAVLILFGHDTQSDQYFCTLCR